MWRRILRGCGIEEDLKGCSVKKDLWAVAEAGILRGCCVAKDLWACHVEKNFEGLECLDGSLRGCCVEDSEGMPC